MCSADVSSCSLGSVFVFYHCFQVSRRVLRRLCSPISEIMIIFLLSWSFRVVIKLSKKGFRPVFCVCCVFSIPKEKSRWKDWKCNTDSEMQTVPGWEGKEWSSCALWNIPIRSTNSIKNILCTRKTQNREEGKLWGLEDWMPNLTVFHLVSSYSLNFYGRLIFLVGTIQKNQKSPG